MKNYKFLIPVVLVVLFAASVYMLYDTKNKEEMHYNQLIENARNFRTQEIYVDAQDNYMQALELKPSIDLYIEIGNMYIESKPMRKVLEWADTIAETYPTSAKAYEFCIDLYSQANDYTKCFQLYDTMRNRKVASEKADELIKSIEYEFFFNGEYSEVGIFSNNYCPVRIGEKWGYANLRGQISVGCQFSKAGYFSGGLAPVVDSDGDAYFIDAEGNKKKVVSGVEKVQELGLIENGTFTLYDGKNWGFYNSENEFLFGGFEKSSSFGNGVAAVSRNGKWILVNQNGSDLTGKEYDNVIMDEKRIVYRNERAFVYYDLGYHMIDVQGNVITDQTFEDAKIFADSTYAAVKTDGKWGFIDKEGNMVIAPQFEDARSFSNGFAAVQKAGRWGFIDMNCNIVIQPQFDNAKDFNSSGCAFIFEDDAWQILRLYKYNH